MELEGNRIECFLAEGGVSMKKRFTEQPIAYALKQAELGEAAAEDLP